MKAMSKSVYLFHYYFIYSRPLVISVLISIGAYPLVTILFERWYTEGFFLAAAFDTFRVYEKSFNNECLISSFLLQVFIIVLSLLPDYIHVIHNSIQTTFNILEYYYNQSVNNGGIQEISSTTYRMYTEENNGCCNVTNILKKRRRFDLVEGGCKRKSYNKSSVMPINQNLDKSNAVNEISKKPYVASNFDKPLEPLSADLLQSKALSLNVSRNEPLVEFRNGCELGAISDNDGHLKKVSNSSNLEVQNDTGLTASIESFLFKHEPNKDHLKNNSNSIERNSLSLMVSYPNSRDELTADDGHDNPSFENSTPVREVVRLESIDNSFITKL